jgi:hypothetical protein
MTPLFIAEFSKQTQCHANCKHKATKRRKFCAFHLVKAREVFRAWSEGRRAIGKCISCQRDGFYDGENVELRCPRHKAINRRRCSAYTYAIVAVTRQTGICHKCPKGNAVKPGTLWCQDCQRVSYERYLIRKARSAS